MINLLNGTENLINDFDGCCYGLREQFSHPPKYIKKPWRIVSWGIDFDDALSRRCDGRHDHAPCAGRETSGTQVYTSNIVSIILKKVNEGVSEDRIVLNNDESRRSPLRVRTRGNKSNAACVVLLETFALPNSADRTTTCDQRHCCVQSSRDNTTVSDFHICLSDSALASCLQPASTSCGHWPIGESLETLTCPEIRSALSMTQPQQTVTVGSGGGTHDLFGGSLARATCAAVSVVHTQQLPGLPMFSRGVGLDLQHAYLWNAVGQVPIASVLSFWFMSDPLSEERARAWLLNLYRHASAQDCDRTIKNIAERSCMVAKIILAQLNKDINSAPGILERFTDYEILTYAESFWGEEFKNLIETRVIPFVYMTTTLEAACEIMRSDQTVGIGYLLEPPGHLIYWAGFRTTDWMFFMREYWVYDDEDLSPQTMHAQFLIGQMKQAASDLTLAIRLKNSLALSEDDKINEVYCWSTKL